MVETLTQKIDKEVLKRNVRIEMTDTLSTEENTRRTIQTLVKVVENLEERIIILEKQ